MIKVGFTTGLGIIIALVTIYILGGALNKGAIALILILSIFAAEVLRHLAVWIWNKTGKKSNNKVGFN